MKIRDRYLVVVALISGRRFTAKPGYNIILEAKFDKEILTSDPVSHTDEPKFEQELAWELDRQALRQHRIKRSSIKLQLFSVDPSTPVKEPIGYLVLDVRSASSKKVFKWLPVLHSKYKTCPSLYCGIYIDSDGHEVVLSVPTSQQTMELECLQVNPKRCLTAKAGRSFQYFQIGPSNIAQEDFLLSIDILSVHNVTSLLLTDTALPAAGLCPFKVALNVLGVDLEGSEFGDPVFASFLEDHFTFNLRSAVDFLRAYFSKEGHLTVRIKCGDQVLAASNVNLLDLLQQVDHAFLKPVSSHETILFHPINAEKQSGIRGPGDGSDAAFVVLRFALQRDSAKAVVSRPLTNCDETVTFSGRPQHLNDTDLLAASKVETNGRNDKQDPTGDILFDLDLAVANLTPNCEPPTTAATVMSPIHPTAVPLQSASRSPPPQASAPVHRFCYSIELKALQAITPLPEDSLVYARYVYPLFGSRSPVMTLPPVALPGTDETVLPQGFCTFELAAEPAEFRQRLTEEPLVVEVLNRNKANNGVEVLLGQASFSLEQVFYEQPHQLAHCSRIRKDGVAAVKSTNDAVAIAKLTYSLTLEDFGPHKSAEEYDEGQPQQKTDEKGTEDTAPVSPLVSRPRSSNPTAPPHVSRRQRISSTDGSVTSCLRPSRSATDLPNAFPPVEVRQTAEYRAALELELWRAEEEARFKASLRQREQKLMAVFAEEWQRRENERELISKKRLSEYQALENKLRATLDSLALREKELSFGEAELERARAEAQRDLQIRQRELSASAKRQIRELEHELSLERSRYENLQTQVTEWQTKCAALERELDRSRTQKQKAETPKPDAFTAGEEDSTARRLQFELVRLNTELAKTRDQLVVTERRLDQALRARARYKELWGRALNEVARLKQEAEANTRQALQRREAEVESWRQRFLRQDDGVNTAHASASAAPQRPPSGEVGQSCSLSQLRSELERLQALQSNRDGEVTAGPSNQTGRLQPNSVNQTQLARLLEERGALLTSGVYEEDDQLILDLDQEIRRLTGQLKPPSPPITA
uniref:C2 domain-containing protein n=1 Tax=Schistocephalus solidus TaxID=70667 RepID=A0A0X3PVH8_SCHSO